MGTCLAVNSVVKLVDVVHNQIRHPSRHTVAIE